MVEFESILTGFVQIAIAGFLGSVLVEFCDKKLPQLLGVKT